MNVLTFYLSFSEVIDAYPQHRHSDIVSLPHFKQVIVIYFYCVLFGLS